jgi:hypothetical protein
MYYANYFGRWMMETCIPQNILESLSHRQKKIEKLWFVTSSSCSKWDAGMCTIDLLAFPDLKLLSWASMQDSMRQTDDTDSLKVAWRQLSRQRVTLEFDPLFGGAARDRPLIPHALEIPSGNTMRLFLAVRTLYLSSVSLRGVAQDMARTLVIGVCRSR